MCLQSSRSATRSGCKFVLRRQKLQLQLLLAEKKLQLQLFFDQSKTRVLDCFFFRAGKSCNCNFFRCSCNFSLAHNKRCNFPHSLLLQKSRWKSSYMKVIFFLRAPGPVVHLELAMGSNSFRTRQNRVPCKSGHDMCPAESFCRRFVYDL